MNRIVEVLIGLKRNSAMAIASIVLIFLTLFMLGFSIIIMENIGSISSEIIESLTITAYVDTNVDNTREQEIIKQISDMPEVKSVILSNKEQELTKVTSLWGESGEMFNDYFSGDKNPLNDVLTIEAVDDQVDLDALTLTVSKIDGIEEATYGGDSGGQELVSFLRRISIIANIVCVIFAFITIFLIINTIKLTINSRKKEIEIMRLVGATKWYIIFPFAVEGMILGFVGGLLAFILVYIAYIQIHSGNAFMSSILVYPGGLKLELFVFQVLFGMVMGLLGSVVAIRSYLKI